MWNETAKKLIAEKGLRHEDLIPVFKVKTRGAVGHYLSGRRDPSPTQLKSLADFLSVRIDDLFVEAPSQQQPSPEALVEAIRALPDTKPLGHRYDWSNPGGLTAQTMISKVLKGGRFDDLIEAANQYGIDELIDAYDADPALQADTCLRRNLENIRIGFNSHRAKASG